MSEPWNWTCPFCQRPQTVTTNAIVVRDGLYVGQSKYGFVGYEIVCIACSNPQCGELTVGATVNKAALTQVATLNISDDVVFTIGNVPGAKKTVQPEYIPAVIREDYYEACDIQQLSPKASATLARRCIQGIIRDFCGIAKDKLYLEIKELRARVDSGTAPSGVLADTIDAIDAVRKIGNIGAHMEKDINIIIDVDPDEAGTLLRLIELLLQEWYVARHDRQQRLAAITAIAAAKDAAKIP